MDTKPLPYSTFEVKSSALCYGNLHNMHHGSTTKLEAFPVPPPITSGIVKMHDLTHNVPAQNGTWTVYQLVDLPSEKVVAWFACHIDINPQLEMDTILRVAGNPYEPDQGDSKNSAKTAEEGVLVINRYDWGCYDERSMKEMNEAEVEPGQDGPLTSVGLVDFEYAPVQIPVWKNQITAERGRSDFGCWFYIPGAEYLFGRFGFNAEHSSARSFLFFAGHTTFTRTAFRGLRTSLRKYETGLERFHRKLREGEKYNGFEMMQSNIGFCVQMAEMRGLKIISRPEKENCLGPYEKNEWVLRATDLDALRQSVNGKLLRRNPLSLENKPQTVPPYNLPLLPLLDFTDSLREVTIGLLNELMLAYLEYKVVPVCVSCSSVQDAATKLCPNREKPRSVDLYIYNSITEFKDAAVPGYNAAWVEAGIKSFLQKRLKEEERTLMDDRDFIRGMGYAVVYLVNEILEMATSHAVDSERDGIVPADIRLPVVYDAELSDAFWLCKAFWFGYD